LPTAGGQLGTNLGELLKSTPLVMGFIEELGRCRKLLRMHLGIGLLESGTAENADDPTPGGGVDQMALTQNSLVRHFGGEVRLSDCTAISPPYEGLPQ